MGPLFTSKEEWEALRPGGERAYVRSAVALTLRAGALGVGVLVLLVGAAEPYWRGSPVLATFAASCVGGGLVAFFLFRREWRAATRAYD